MERFRFNLALVALIFFLPNSSGEVSITANGEPNIIFVNSGENVTFMAKGTENSSSILWDFSIDINGPNTRYSNLTEIELTVHASGRYNVTLTAYYEDQDTILRELILIVNYEEDFKENIIRSDALFFAIATSEVIMSLALGYWTLIIRKEKSYLWRLVNAIIESNDAKTKSDNEESSSDDSLKVSSASLSPSELLVSWPTLTIGP